jgi:hypothetical protein
MMLRAVAFGAVCAGLLLGISIGDAEAAKKKAKAAAAPRCLEAVVPKCAAPKVYYCTKRSKCASACQKWACALPGAVTFAAPKKK